MNLERDDAVNWSTLKHIDTSPKHYLHILANPREDSDALLRGRVVHALNYEPDEFDQRYVVEPRFHGGMKDETAIAKGYAGGKEAKAAWAANKPPGAEIVSAEIYADCVGMRDALQADPEAGPMFVGGFAEQLLTWVDEETGIECRGRIDHLNGRLSDLKSTRVTGIRQFHAEIARRLYHGQIAYYYDGVLANGIEMEHSPVLITVENAAPYDVTVHHITPAVLRAGRDLYRNCLRRLAECRKTGEWPGVSGGAPVDVELPDWAAGPKAEEITIGGVPIF